MPAGALDARLLVPVGGQVPAAAALADLEGTPAIVRIEGDWSVVAGLGAASAALVGEFLRHVPVLTLAVAPDGASVAGLCDLWTASPAEADAWAAGFERAPGACVAAALLVRSASADTWAALVAESTAYSLLQAGPEFRRWLASYERRPPAASDDAPRVGVRFEDGVREITLTRAWRHNALDTRMRDELVAACAEALDGNQAVLLRGDGPSFCSGGDLDDFGTFPDPVTSHVVRVTRSTAMAVAAVAPRLVAGLHGACLGAGIELPAFAARVVAADDVRIALPEAGLGLIPGAGGTVSIPRRAGRHRLLDLLVSGRTIDGATALAWGLVDEVVPSDQLEERARHLARELRP